MVVSERRLAANRSNAKKSTGPTSEAGKKVTRKNALRHGMCAEVVPCAHEDEQAIEAERRAWVDDLAKNTVVAVRLAESAFAAHLRLTRCRRAEVQAIRDRQARAEAEWVEARAKERSEAIQILVEQPQVALARLESTPDGCRWLADHWRGIAHKLENLQWEAPTDADDLDDTTRLLTFLGLDGEPNLELFETVAAYRQWLADLAACRKRRISSTDSFDDLARVFDREVAAEMIRNREAGRRSRDRLRTLALRMIEKYVDLERTVTPAYELRRSLAVDIALVDTSPEGMRLNRYIADAERLMHRNIVDALAVGERDGSDDSDAEVAEQLAPPPHEDTQCEALLEQLGSAPPQSKDVPSEQESDDERRDSEAPPPPPETNPFRIVPAEESTLKRVATSPARPPVGPVPPPAPIEVDRSDRRNRDGDGQRIGRQRDRTLEAIEAGALSGRTDAATDPTSPRSSRIVADPPEQTTVKTRSIAVHETNPFQVFAAELSPKKQVAPNRLKLPVGPVPPPAPRIDRSSPPWESTSIRRSPIDPEPHGNGPNEPGGAAREA
ncbi:MAG: hypothetical protein SFX72_19230 [Isosphaeraceae bacterium]|nr:hypothetical protein [Isosphaeraceae bacterium]